MATTENPEKVLLTTFLRRVPVHVKLPDFASRPIDERLELYGIFSIKRHVELIEKLK